ncbi:MAG TPA: 1-(5-phosphoribosyl)-5-[(5-phosphoribosylamino)methylideneamino]imidazole-4-carboxamide isomerase [Candidatus Baltobacteraceae bacterium]|jgi:phosphoribosylformimino-5-aminoimidazole carboxamide ribotide isomerase|nr:1-(5-phosphoribosyl)-5-[(5-phosphoribosylamino)methylideneamino]imidazole-4-carboxamide isomerase [Candidatus Baltobacteraceae bacterium]
MSMLVIPAIDLRGGRCVRMQRGDPSKEKTYAADPVDQAKEFVREGARALHVIDLDGAFGSGENAGAIRRICQAVDVPVQSGGGIRTLPQAQARFDAGVSYVILGTLLVEDERIARNIIATFGDRVFAGIDARGSSLAVRGWQEGTPVDRDALVQRVNQWGVNRVIFTEIGRDGTGEGFDIGAVTAVANAAPVRVTVSGGASTLDDLQALRSAAPENVDACVVGRALYEHTIDLAQAIQALSK